MRSVGAGHRLVSDGRSGPMTAANGVGATRSTMGVAWCPWPPGAWSWWTSVVMHDIDVAAAENMSKRPAAVDESMPPVVEISCATVC